MYMNKTILAAMSGLSLFASAAHADSVWAPGVSEKGGWYDFNKFSEGAPAYTTNSPDSRYTDDSGLCWAASAANVIAWWQEQNKVTSVYTDMGRMIPQGKDIYQTYVSVFDNDGGDPANAIKWWVDGSATPVKKTDFGNDGSPYWTSVDGDLYCAEHYSDGAFLTSPYHTPTPFYSFDGNPVTIQAANIAHNSLTVQSRAIVEALQSGYVLALEVNTNGGSIGTHAITLWGVEYNEDTNGDISLTKAYITDSDDYGTRLVAYSVDIKGNLYRTGTNLAYTITEAHGMRTSVIAVPEPTASGLSLLALAGFAARRRRK